MNNGSIVYFKRAKETSSPRGKFVEFKGHGIGILLGHVPPFKQDCNLAQARCLLGMVGYITLDDVAEFLGKERMDECITKFQAKYYTPPPAVCTLHSPPDPACDVCLPPRTEEAPMPAPSNLVGIDGKPLN